MICQHCKTNNVASAKVCWSCGQELRPTAGGARASTRTNVDPTGNVDASRLLDTNNDFWMGALFGHFGMLCATIIDKRRGFWAAFWGLLMTVLVCLVGWFVVDMLALHDMSIVSDCMGTAIGAVLAWLCYVAGHRK